MEKPGEGRRRTKQIMNSKYIYVCVFINARVRRTSEIRLGAKEGRGADAQAGGDRQRPERDRRRPGRGQTQVGFLDTSYKGQIEESTSALGER